MDVKVLGSGCSRCVNFANETDEALLKMESDMKADRIFDLDVVREFNLQSTPALVVNDEVIVSGEALNAEQIYELLERLKTS